MAQHKYRWDINANGRNYTIEFVRNGLLDGSLLVNGQSYAIPAAKWYSPFLIEHSFSLNEKEILLQGWGTEYDLVIDGMYVVRKTPYKKYKHDLFSWIGHFISLGCLASIALFYTSPVSIIVAVLAAISNEIFNFSPLCQKEKQLLYNVIALAVAWGGGFWLSSL